MAAAAHDPAFAKKMGIPQNVAQEFNQADKGSSMLKDAMANRMHAQQMRKAHGSSTPKRAY